SCMLGVRTIPSGLKGASTMSEEKKHSFPSQVESIEIEPEMDLPRLIGDEWADPEEILYDSNSDCIDAEIEARKHHKSLLF
ncbi:MAG: hypothetical protein V1897_16700, partial [Pseudomonadota bacterium]